MKPRRLLLSVDPLPMIREMQEEGATAQTHQSLEDYVDSIKELALPASVPGCGPLRLQRTQRPRLFVKHAPPPSSSRHAARISRPRTGVALKRDGSMDPLDWLFTQTQQDAPAMREKVPAAPCLI